MRTNDLFMAANRLIKERNKAREEYRNTLNKLEEHKGSLYYKKESKKAVDKLTEKETAAINAFKATANELIKDMDTSRQGYKPRIPTEEQTRLLTVLRMRKSVSNEELEQAAKVLSDSYAAMRTLQDIADGEKEIDPDSAHYMKWVNLSKEMNPRQIEIGLQAIAAACRRLIAQQSGSRAREVYSRYANRQLDIKADPFREYESEKDFYSSILPNSVNLDSFSEQVNA